MIDLLELRPAPGLTPEYAALSAFLVYENVATGVRAKQTAELVAESLGSRLQLHLWNAELLAISTVGDTVMEDASGAEIVIISVQRGLPPRLLGWVRRWLSGARKRPGALLAIFEQPADAEAIRARDLLREEALRVGLDFFSEDPDSGHSPAVSPALWIA